MTVDAAAGDVPAHSRLARALGNAVVLGESKGDDRQAAKILDATLAREQDSAPVVDLVGALVYRAELAIRLGDGARADTLLARVRGTGLTDTERRSLDDALANAAELEQTRSLDPSAG